jgi:CRP-like cAMP-binding protein
MSLTDDDWSMVRACELFRGMPDQVVRDLLSGRAPAPLHKGQILFHQGDPALAFFVVLEGWMRIYRTDAGGVETIIHVAKAGETFAEAAMFMESVYPVNAEALTPVRLQRIDGRAVQERMSADPSFAFAMLGAMSLRLRRLVNEIEQLKRRSATELVADFLLQLCTTSDDETLTVVLPFEKAMIAARLGIKPESFSRALARLKSVGVEVSGPSVALASRLALARITGDNSSPPLRTASNS